MSLISLPAAWLLIFIAALNSTAGNILLKKSREDINQGLLDWLFNPLFIGGLFFYAVNVILFAKALERLPVSVAYPTLAGIGFLTLVIFSNVFLGEKLNGVQILGVILILAGVFALAKA
jgi:undecaprenyl phosphate-alpha-L-ara4N flippase subunit ArnE